MGTLLLNKDYIINEKLVNIIEDMFQEIGISESFNTPVFRGLTESELPEITGSKFSLLIRNLENKDDLILRNENFAKVFEVIGTNQRFKTTSLIIIALIFGFKFNQVDDFIASNQLLTRVNQMQQIIFSANETSIEMKLENEKHTFSFFKQDNYLKVECNGEVKKFTLTKDKYDDSVFVNYHNYILKQAIADVQFVSKGRNFVGYVHKEIRNEFLFTLKIIRENLRQVIEEGFKEKQNSEKIKNYVEIENSLVFIQKAKDIITRIDIPLEKLSVLANTKLQPGSINEKEVTSQIEKIKKDLGLLKEECVELFERKDQTYKQVLLIIEEINKFCTDLPFNFGFHGLIQNLEKFKLAWPNISKSESLGNIPDKSEEEQIVNFTVTSEFFPRISVNSLTSFKRLENMIVDANSKIELLIDVISKNEADIEKLMDQYEQIDLACIENSKQTKQLEMQIKQLEARLKLTRDIEQHINLEDDIDIHEYLEKKGIIKNFHVLVKYLEKVNVIYKNQGKNELLELLENYQGELLKIRKTKKNVFILPKKIQDLMKMPQILQEIDAVITYLTLDKSLSKQETEIIVKASKDTVLHERIISVFNEYMAERCGYYFEVNASGVQVHPLKYYNFEMQEFDIGIRKVSTREGISGGTDSAMTVRSFASKLSTKKFGAVLLVDEWGDVGERLAAAVYQKIEGLPNLGLCLFVRVDNNINNPQLIDVRGTSYEKQYS